MAENWVSKFTTPYLHHMVAAAQENKGRDQGGVNSRGGKGKAAEVECTPLMHTCRHGAIPRQEVPC